MQINKLLKSCEGSVELAAWCCGVRERQMRYYMEQNELPPERAALAELRITLIKEVLRRDKKGIRSNQRGSGVDQDG